MNEQVCCRLGRILPVVFAGLLALTPNVQAQVQISSVVPTYNATGVSVNSSVVFTFNQPMDTNMTVAMFNAPNSQYLPLSSSWSADGTILTYTPMAYSPLPANSTITWTFLIGYAADGMTPLSPPLSGWFTTGAASGTTGTNATTHFTAGKLYYNHQDSAGAPVLDTNAPYMFSAVVNLASNRTANAISLTLPTGAVSNLTGNIMYREDWYLTYASTNETTFLNTWTNGLYTFNVQATTNLLVTNNLPSTMAQPNAPHLTNYAAAQAVNPSATFTLGWDAFQGGTASDYINVSVGDVWNSPDYLVSGALNGTARTVQVPAGTLQPGSNYTSRITFYRLLVSSNAPANFTTVSYKATTTEFNLATTGSSGPALVFKNPVYSAGTGAGFSFDLDCPVGQLITIQSSTNLSSTSWVNLLTTTPSVSPIHVSDPRAVTNRSLFYRAKLGT